MNKINKIIKPNIYKKFNNYIISDINSLNVNYIDLNIIKDSFKMLQIDKYHNNNKGPPTRLRKFFNIDIDMENKKKYNIKYNHHINIFKQQVEDNRSDPRKFSLIDDKILYSHFMVSLIYKISSLIQSIEDIKKLNISIHQVRQICYPNIVSENSPEGIHQDGADYIIPALVLNRFNIRGGVSSVYNNRKDQIYRTMLGEDEFIFQDDRVLYHYVTPIRYYLSDGFEEYGYRDLLGLDITIVE